MDQLQLATHLAREFHHGQFRRDRVTDYILHPIAVSNHPSLKNDEKARAVAMLHDILEDTEATAELLLNRGVDKDIVEAVEVLTKRDNKTYEAYLYRVLDNEMARKVKIADMICNLADDPTDRQIKKYAFGLHFLTNVY